MLIILFVPIPYLCSKTLPTRVTTRQIYWKSLFNFRKKYIYKYTIKKFISFFFQYIYYYLVH